MLFYERRRSLSNMRGILLPPRVYVAFYQRPKNRKFFLFVCFFFVHIPSRISQSVATSKSIKTCQRRLDSRCHCFYPRCYACGIEDHRLWYSHHELRPPLVVLVANVVQSFNHVMQTGQQVPPVSWLQKRATELPEQHRSVVHQEVIPEKKKIHGKFAHHKPLVKLV